MLCVVVDSAEHKPFTEKWQEAIPYGIKTTQATIDEIWKAAQWIYAKYPILLDAAKEQLFGR